MNNKTNYINFFSNFKTKISDNKFIIIFVFIFIIIFFIALQIYFFYENKKILNLSIKYTESKLFNSEENFLEIMQNISNEKNFYGFLASLELINQKILNKNFNESYNDYLLILNNKKIEKIYKTALAISASYNLIDHIEPKKIHNLLSFISESHISFNEYHLEILFLLSIIEKNNDLSKKLYNQIIENDLISPSIKERVKKINEFENNK